MKSKWKTGVVSVVLISPSWFMVLKLWKIVSVLQFSTDGSETVRAWKADEKNGVINIVSISLSWFMVLKLSRIVSFLQFFADIPCLKAIIVNRFTCGERKICYNIKNSKNIMKVVLGKMLFVSLQKLFSFLRKSNFSILNFQIWRY